MYTRGHAVVARDRFDRDVHRPLDDARNNDVPFVDRIRALWSLAGARADVRVDGGTLIGSIGALLAHPNAMFAREACELLCHLVRAEHRPAEIDVAVGARHGALVVSPRSFARCEPLADHRAWCPDVDAEVVPLVDVHRAQSKLSTPLALLQGTASASTLVVVTGAKLWRVRRAGRLGVEANAPHAVAAGGAFRVGSSHAAFVVDGARVEEAMLTGHHELQWGDVRASVVVAPSLSDHARVLVEIPDGGFEAVAIGDAWFSRLKHAHGHIAITPERRALVVDTTNHAPHVTLLEPGDATTFGAYDAEFLEHAGVLRITARTSTGPDRSRPAVKQSASAKKQAA